DGQIRVADAPEKSSIFLFKTVLVFSRSLFCPPALVLLIAPPRALDAESQVIIEQNRQVGLQIAAEYFVQLEHCLRTQLASPALVSLGRIGEAIAKHDAPFGKRRQNDLVNMLCARGEHERHLCHRRKSRSRGVQQDFANLFARSSSAGFAGYRDGKTVRAQRARQLLGLCALAAAIEPFESNEFSTSDHVGDDSRRASRRDGRPRRPRQLAFRYGRELLILTRRNFGSRFVEHKTENFLRNRC